MDTPSSQTKPSSWIIAALAVATFSLILYIGNDHGSSAAPSAPAASSAPDAVGDAARACTALKTSGASACSYGVHFSEPSSIEATFGQQLADPADMCTQIAGLLRSQGAGLRNSQRRWELRLFTHISTRPAASCLI